MNSEIDIKNKLDEGLTFKISRFKEKIKKTSPHKHDDYYGCYSISARGFYAYLPSSRLVRDCTSNRCISPINLNHLCTASFQ